MNQKQNKQLKEIRDHIGKLPPQATDIEEVILGAIMLDKKVISIVANKLIIDAFYKDSHKIIYSACLDLWNESNPIDILTVVQKLKSLDKLESVGGAFFISSLTSRINSSSNTEYHVAIVRQKGIQRKLISICQDYLNKSYEDTNDVPDLVHGLMSEVESINTYLASLGKKTIKQHSLEAKESIKKAKEHKGELVGIDTSFKQLNRMIGGFEPSDLIIIAGRPGMGKTALILSSILHQIKSGLKVSMFSLEMKGSQLLIRLVSQETGIAFSKIKRGQLNEKEQLRVDQAFDLIESKAFFMDDLAAPKPADVKAKLIDDGADIVYIDYLQLMTGNKKSYGNNREVEVSDISRSLKIIAKELDIPVVALAQLSRAVETRGGNKIPKLADLRESGAIEQDADIVIFVYRPEYYGLEGDYERDGESLLIVEKSRNGEPGSVNVQFVKYLMRYQDFEDIEDERPPFPETEH